MNDPNNIVIKIKSYNVNTSILEVSIDSDIDDIPESKTIAYQISSFANTNINSILKSIAINGLSNIRREIKHREVSGNNELVNTLNSLVNTSITFTISDIENVVVYPIGNTAQEILIS